MEQSGRERTDAMVRDVISDPEDCAYELTRLL